MPSKTLFTRPQVWTERKRWEGFLLLARKYATEKPPHCLGVLVTLPTKQLKALLQIAPNAKPALWVFITRHPDKWTAELKALLK